MPTSSNSRSLHLQPKKRRREDTTNSSNSSSGSSAGHMYPADIQPILAQSHLRPYGVHRSPSPTFPNHPARPQPTTQYTKGIRLWKRLLSPLTRGEHSPSTVSRIRCYLCFEAVSISLTPPSPSPSSSSDGTKPACLPVEHRRRICRGGSSKRGCLFRVDIPLVRLLVRRRWQ